MAFLLALTAQAPLAVVVAPVVRGATLDVCASGCPYTTIAAALTAAAPGDTIQVAAGTYSAALTISKSVTLRGVKAGVAAGPSATPADRNTADPYTGESVITAAVTVTANDVTIDGFVIKTTASSLTVRGRGIVVANDILVGRTTSNYGVTSSATTGDNSYTITNNRIVGGAKGIYLQGGTLTTASTVSGNYISFPTVGSTVGIETAASFAGSHSIADNEVTGAASGIVLGVSGSTITHNTIGGLVGTTPTGIKATATSAALTITGNRVTGGRYGIQLVSPSVATSYTVTGNYLVDQLAASTTSGALWVTSVITAPKDASNNYVTPSWATVDATGNYWGGAPAGRVGSGTIPSWTIVTTGPWVVGYTLDEAKAGLPGFWTTATTTTCTTDCYVAAATGSDANDGSQATPFATIHAGVAAVASGGTVHVGPGTYAGKIQVIRPMTIVGDPGDATPGPGSNAPIVDNAGAAGDGFNLINGLHDVTIAGFEIRNLQSGGDINGTGVGVQAYLATTASITVADNWFHDVGYAVLVGNDGSGAKYALGTHTGWSVVRNVVERFGAVGIELTDTSDSTVGDNIVHMTAGTFNGVPHDAILAIFSYVRIDQDRLTISGNTVDGALNPTYNGGGYPAVYVYVRDANLTGQTLDDLVIEQNRLEPTGTAPAVVVRDSATGHVMSARVSANALTTSAALANRTALTLAATGNWWGTAAGPATGQVEGTAATNPWITAYDPDPAKAGLPGFWPVNVVHGIADVIEPGTTDTVVGDEDLGSPTIEVAAGAEPVTVTVTAGADPVEEPGRTPFAAGATIVDFSATGAVGPFTVCLAGASPATLWHYTGGTWVEVTPVDYASKPGFVCGSVDSLSPFAAEEALPELTPAVTIASRPYDGGTSAQIAACTLAGVVAPDVVTCATTGATASFADAAPGTDKPVAVTGLALGGADAGKYFIDGTAATVGTIEAVGLTAIVTIAPKTYDGTTAATITGCTLIGIVGSDEVECSAGTATATFADPAAGTAKAVTVTGLVLVGADAARYALGPSVATSGTIDPAALTVTADSTTVTYGAAVPAIGYAASGFVGSETFLIPPACGTTYAQGAGIAGSPYPTSCASASTGSNYVVTYVPGTLTVAARTLTVSADSTTVTYADPSPAIGFTAVGFVGVDGWATEPSCTAPTYLPGGFGTFPTICAGGDAGPNYAIVFQPGALTVVARELGAGAVVYTGQLFHYVNSSTETVQVVLSASVTADFGGCVDGGPTVAAAHIHFVDMETGKVLARDVPIAAIDCNNGTATSYATLSAGPTGIDGYHMHAVLSGPLAGDNSDQDVTTSTVYLLVALTSNGMTGVGSIGHQAAVSSTDLGTYGSLHDPASTGSVSYGFNVVVSASTKKGSPTIKGEINLWIPGTYRGSEGTYFVKATAFNSIGTNATTKITTVYSKAVVQFIPYEGATVSVDGGASLRVDAKDGLAEGPDLLGVTLTSSKSSTLYYSNDWTKVGKAWQTTVTVVGAGASPAVVVK